MSIKWINIIRIIRTLGLKYTGRPDPGSFGSTLTLIKTVVLIVMTVTMMTMMLIMIIA